MDVQPLYDRILVKRFPEEHKAPGGLLIPDSAEQEPNEGRVIAIGKGEPLHEANVHGLAVALGDRVRFTKGSGTELRIAGQLHLILREDDVLAIVG